MKPLLISDSQPTPSRGEIGGKAEGLFRLRSLGIPVPPFCVLTAEAWKRSTESIEIEAALDEAWKRLGSGSPPLAVRSSGIDEDGAERSYAGQMETFLNVVDRPALSRAVRGCWESLHSERAKAYRAARGGTGGAMAVVLQQMLDPEVSGVLFTVNPSNGRADELLASAVWGLGEGLVSGTLDADTFVLDRQGRLKSSTVVEKRERIAWKKKGGTERRTVEEAKVRVPALTETQLSELARAALRVSDAAGSPQDIEFSIAGGKLFLLQARPVTSFRPAGERQVWDNSNIIESYPGLTLPMTFSFIRRAYHAVYWQFCEVLGLPPREIRRRDPMLWNMLGHIHGRVYYNLLNWYRLVSLLPGFEFNRSFMETMMGLRDRVEMESGPATWKERYLQELPRLVRTGFRAILLHRRLPRLVQSFHRDFAEVYREHSGVDFDTLPPAEIWKRYRDLECRILWRWKAPIINDFEAMIFYGALKKLTVAWNVDPDGSLQNALLSGEGNIESTRVTERLLDLAREISGEAGLARTFSALAPEKAEETLRQHPRLGPRFMDYLERYGDRAAEELKLESRTMKDDPAFCAAMIQDYLRAGLSAMPTNDRKLHDGAHDLLDRRLTGRCLGGLVRRKSLYLWVLECARRAVRNRENQRLERTRAFGLVRRILRALEASFVHSGFLDFPDDIHYLTMEELEEHLERGAAPNWKGLVRERRAQYESYRTEPAPPDHFITYGDPGSWTPDPAEGKAASTDGTLTGLGACPGEVEARAVVLEKPDRTIPLQRAILVAKQTDPGWVVLFPSISGLVVERGSMLSHSAIVAREMGIPAVVGVRDATRLLRTDDRILLDGQKGTVKLLKRGKE